MCVHKLVAIQQYLPNTCKKKYHLCGDVLLKIQVTKFQDRLSFNTAYKHN